MASFLDNSGDIVLDAVLTDYGRQLLAKGDGSFNIVKFALGDDEIDYTLWDSSAESPNKDTAILSTPVLEAFTNNAASMKSKLLTINIENLLFLPIMVINTIIKPTGTFNGKFTGFVIPVDVSNNETTVSLVSQDGVVVGFGAEGKIVVDQGFDSNSTDKQKSLFDTNPELFEREYNIFLDHRLGRLMDISSPLSVDDDGMAVYRVTADNTAFVTRIPTDSGQTAQNALLGSPGSRLQFKIVPQVVLSTTNTYFNTLGNSGVELVEPGGDTFKTIKSYVRIVGVTTGYSLEIPILYAKVE